MHGLELKCKTPSWKQYDHSSPLQSYCFNCNQMKYFRKLPEEIFLWCALNAFFSTILSPEETTLSNGAGRSCWLLRVMVGLIYVFVDICEWDTEDKRPEGSPSLCYYSLIFLSFWWFWDENDHFLFPQRLIFQVNEVRRVWLIDWSRWDKIHISWIILKWRPQISNACLLLRLSL